jgi:hypothetical protein
MKTYQVHPSGEEALSELILGKGSPGAEFFEMIGGRSHVFRGLPGFKVGNVHYSADPNYLNVITVNGIGDTPFLIEMPVTSIAVYDDVLITFEDKDSNSRLTVRGQGFSLDIGKTIAQAGPKNLHKPSPWK